MLNQIQVWTLAARPKTLVAALSPVLIGVTLAIKNHSFDLLIALITFATALGIQIGTNLANDLFDCLKGADTTERKGPIRVTQEGLVSSSAIKKATALTFLLTACLGSYLVWHGGFIIAALLALSIVLGIIYTAGPYPLAYLGLGDLFVFVFFGPVAVAGTYYLQTHTFSIEPVLIGPSCGALSTAILVVNNTRDMQEDRKNNKKTLAVRFGKKFSQLQYLLLILLSPLPSLFFYNSHPLCILSFLTLIPAIPLIRSLFSYKDPRELNLLLEKTGQLLSVHTLIFCIGWLL